MLYGDLECNTYWVALTGTRWNIFVPWLHEMDTLRRSNLFPALGVCRAKPAMTPFRAINTFWSARLKKRRALVLNQLLNIYARHVGHELNGRPRHALLLHSL
jgi:hypothetical protein